MNPTSPSPLVPQGAIPPKDTSRSKRVLMVATMVVGLHVAGLSVVLFQGCGKDSTKGGTAANADTNTTSTAMSYPATPDTNPPAPMFTSASNAAPGTLAQANTNLPALPAPTGAFGGPTGTVGVGSNLAGPGDAGIAAPIEQPAPIGNYKDYKIQKGDLLSTLAVKNGVTIGSILKANANLDPKKLRIGQTIKIPAPAPAAATSVAGTGSTPPTGALGSTPGAATGSAMGTYKVKPGDTLTKIARAHGITVNQLRAANNMKTTQVQVGKVLKIPARSQKTAAANTNTALH